MPILKQCSYHSCSKIVEYGVKYCPYHQEKFEEQERERYKQYSNRRRQDKEQKKYQDFYNSRDWLRIRQVVIAECFGVDIVELYRTGRIIQGYTVHHIVELNEDWNSRLDVMNLIYLTEQNHRRVHVEHSKGTKDREKMQKILFELLDRFNKEYR